MDIGKLTRELVRASEGKDTVLVEDLLVQLDSASVSREDLQSTGLGKELGRLAKQEWSASVATRSRALVDKLRAHLKASPAPVRPFSAPAAAPSPSPVAAKKAAAKPVVSEVVRSVTGVKKRDTIIAKLAGAMRAVLDESSELGITMSMVEERAAAIEEVLERDFGANDHGHKTKFLQLVRNLRNEGNTQLRLRVVVGHLSCDELMTLTAVEMAPEQVQLQIKDLEAYNKEASKSRKPTGEITRQFGACGKCKCPTTSYFMMQTRSADEPMTIFITCTNCGHSWRK